MILLILAVQNLSAAGNGDDMRVATIELEYPRIFNFGGSSGFEFILMLLMRKISKNNEL